MRTTGTLILATSRAYLAGVRAGTQLARRTYRTGIIVLALSGVCIWGTGLGLLWASADIFFEQTTGQTPITTKVIGKWQAWWRVHPQRGPGSRQQ